MRHERAPRARGPHLPRRLRRRRPGFARDLASLGGCRTGEAKCVPARQPARRIILTVGPRYADKYRTAAENALSHCYRGALECAVEAEARTVAFPSSTRTPRDTRERTARTSRENAPSISRALAREIRRRGVMRGRARRGTLRGNGGATRDASNVFPRTPPRRASRRRPSRRTSATNTARRETPSATSPSRPSPWGSGCARDVPNETGFDVPVAVAVCEFPGQGGIPESARAASTRGRGRAEDDWFWGDDLAVPRRFARVPRRRHRARRRPGTRVRDANDFCRTRRTRISPTWNPPAPSASPGEILSVDAW